MGCLGENVHFIIFSKTEQTKGASRGEEQVGTSKEEKKKKGERDKAECLRAAAMTMTITMNADDPTVKQVAITGAEGEKERGRVLLVLLPPSIYEVVMYTFYPFRSLLLFLILS